jgi:hypothetical protein
MTLPKDAIEKELEAALRAATDDDTRYHIRQALQLRIAERHINETGARTEV